MHKNFADHPPHVDHPISQDKPVEDRRWACLRLLMAAILLVAALFKAHQLATAPSLGVGLLHARWFNILVVEFELFFSLWLLFGLLPRVTRLAAIGCFTVFATVSLFKALSGSESCDCFGALELNPWVTVILDLCILAALFRFPPQPHGTEQVRPLKFQFNPQWINMIFSWLVIALPVSWAILTFKPAVLSTDGQILGSSDAVILEPRDWINKPFPLLEHIHLDQDLRTGSWIVVFYGVNCSQCRKHFETWQRSGLPLASTDHSIAVLEITGKPQNELRAQFGPGSWFWGSLHQTHTWYLETPQIVELDNGVVRQVWTQISNDNKKSKPF